MTIVKAIAGSNLFGLETPTSDRDYKGVFIESLENIVLQKDSKCISTSTNKSDDKNNSEDVDTEMKELRTFLKDCINGQTYALELLYTPDDKIIETSEIWSYIQSIRSELTTNNLKPFIGYALGQSRKYSLRGKRLEELERVCDWFKEQNPDAKLFEIVDKLKLSEDTYKTTYQHKNGSVEYQITCLGMVLQYNKYVKEILPSLQKRLDMYGGRAKKARDNNGVDWKAYSHAFRLIYEWEQLLTEGKLTFPIPNRKFVKQVKLGRIEFTKCQDFLYSEFDRVDQIPNNLPKPNIKLVEEIIKNTYL